MSLDPLILANLAQALIADRLIVGDPGDLAHFPVQIPAKNIRPMYDNSTPDPGAIAVFGFTNAGFRPTFKQDKFEGSLVVQVQSPKDMAAVIALHALITAHLTTSDLSSTSVKVHLLRETPNGMNPLAPKDDMFWRNTTYKVLAVRP